MFSAPIFLLLASVIQYASTEKYAYVKFKIPFVKCTDIPNDGLCPRDHKIPDLSEIAGSDGKPLNSLYNKTIINETLTTLLGVLEIVGANETCKQSFRAYICSQFLPDCEEDSDFFYASNGERVFELCKQTKENCSTSPSATQHINCTTTGRRKIPKRGNISCQAYPDIKDDPYPCSKLNFKGPSSAFGERNKIVFASNALLKNVNSTLDRKCFDDVGKMVCEATGPACTRDEKYIVDLVSKQDCQKIMGCLNVTKDVNVINGAFRLCDILANATTAQKISLSLVYGTNNATTKAEFITTTKGASISTTEGASISTTNGASISTTEAASISTTNGASISTTKGASIAIMFSAFLYFMEHLHYV